MDLDDEVVLRMPPAPSRAGGYGVGNYSWSNIIIHGFWRQPLRGCRIMGSESNIIKNTWIDQVDKLF